MKPQEVTQYMDIVTKGFASLATQLKQPVGFVWELALRQNYANLALDAFWAIVSIIFFIVLHKVFKWGLMEDKDAKNNFYYHDNIMISSMLVGIIGGTISLVVFLLSMNDLILRFVNPKWMAIQDIVNLVKNK